MSTDKPSAPVDLKVTGVTEDTVSLTYDEPKDDGGCEIEQYVIDKREQGKRSWISAGNTTELNYTIEKLQVRH